MQKYARLASEKEEKIALLLSSNPYLTLQEIAHSIGVDRHIIQCAIREHYGLGFRRLRRTIRVNRACAILGEENPQCYVKEVAAELGISPNYLSRLIKSTVGITPTGLRRLKR
jgi:methylphosphotriester-DNA--protein-cysteine methyltransferase